MVSLDSGMTLIATLYTVNFLDIVLSSSIEDLGIVISNLMIYHAYGYLITNSLLLKLIAKLLGFIVTLSQLI